MKPKILQRQVLPSVLWFIMLFILARIIDQVLHDRNLEFVGRYLGIPGSVLISLSFIYSIRKNKFINFGKIKYFLKIHETMAWLGSLMILIHAGIHYHAIIPWIALASMLVVVISGFTGSYLQKVAQGKLSESREALKRKGLTDEQIEETLYFDSLTVSYMKKWRSVHLTIASFFSSISIFHILSGLWFFVK